MKKLRNRRGHTLIELLAVLMILVFLVIGIGAGMDTGLKIYREAMFEADSATLAGILNTNLGDILRYSQNIKPNPGTFLTADNIILDAADVPFAFSNRDYGIKDAYFVTPEQENDAVQGVLQMKSLTSAVAVELVNTGAYPDLQISDFEISYVEPGDTAGDGSTLRGGYFTISYTIFSDADESLTRDVEYVVRMMNAESAD